MAGVAIGEVVRCDLIAEHYSADDVVNVFQFSPSVTVADNADVLDDLIAIMTAIVTIVKALANAGTVWERIRAQNITNGLILGEAAFPSAIAGTAVGEPNAAQIAAVVTMKTGVPRVNLRKYWGPLAEAHIDGNGLITSAAQTVVANAGALLLDPFIEANATWRYGHQSPKTGLFELPNIVVVPNVPATQRRRRRGIGS